MTKKILRSLFVVSLAISALSAVAQLPPSVQLAQDDAFERLTGVQPGVRVLKNAAKIDRIYGPAFGAGSSAGDAFQSFMSAYAGLFAPGDARFEFRGTQLVGFGDFLTGTFAEYYGAYPVDRGEVTLLARNEIGYPIVLAVNSGQTVQGPFAPPRVTANAAVSILKKHHPSLKSFGKPSLIIWMGETNGHLAWTFEGSSPTSPTNCTSCGSLPEHVQAFVDAHTGRVLEERQLILSLDVNGNVSGWATPGLKPDQANNPETLQPMHNVGVNITGGNSAFTDPSGNFTIAHGGTTQVTVNAPLTGRWARVVNAAGTTDSLSQNVTPPGPADFIFNTAQTQFTTAQTNGYIFTNRVHDFIKAYSPSYPGVDFQIPVNVNVTGSCNAFFTTNGGISINFYQAAAAQPGCPNMAYSTVVWHEYGHFVVNRGGTSQGGYGEGMGDTIGSLLADHPWTGEDFSGPNTGPLRSAINSVTYPSSAEIHTQGMIVSGAFWGTVLQLDNTVGHAAGLDLVRSLAINSILLHPPTISPGMTVDVLTLDDTDANIMNGTPHYNEIDAGFGAKGLPAPRLIQFTPITRVPLFVNPQSYGRRVLFAYDIVAAQPGALDTSSAKVFFRVNGGAWQSNPMTLGGGNTFAGEILLPPSGSIVDWYLEAKVTQGSVNRFPANAPAQYESMIVASALQTIVEDMMETGAGWTVSNGASLTAGAWVRADPNGTNLNGAPANPENDSADAGVNCFFTGQGAVGAAVGTQDVDGGPTRLISPTYDLSGNDAIIEYKRWFFNDDGDDFLTVEVSNDNGATWALVETVGGIQNTWVQRSFRLRSYVASSSQIKLRFSTSDNPNNSITEAAIDHVVVRMIVP